MNFIPFIVLGLLVAVLPFLGFPRATEDTLISFTGLIIVVWAALKTWRHGRPQQPQASHQEPLE